MEKTMQSYPHNPPLSTPPEERWFGLLQRAGRNPKWHGRYYTARCPVHDDRQASLMHTRGFDVPICLAGCESHELWRWAGDDLQRTLPAPVHFDRDPESWRGNPLPNLPPMHTADALEYLQGIGTEAGGSIDYAHPDGRRARHWRDSQKTVRNPGMTGAGWYPRLMLPDDPGQAAAIVVAEGEKDAARACLMGYIAVASPGGGARGKAAFWDEVVKHATGMPLPVVIVPDNDTTGRKFGDEVARIIRIAGAVCHVAHPTDMPKGDCILDAPDGSDQIKCIAQVGETTDDHLSAWEKAESQGHTDGKTPLPDGILWLKKRDFPPTELTDQDPIGGKSRFLPKEPYRPPDMSCLVNGAQWCLFHLPNRERKVVHFACGKCEMCLGWRKHLIVCRYGLVRGRAQTLLRVSGFDRADDASAWSKKQSARVGRHHRSKVPRWRGIDRTGDYRYSLTIVYDEELPARLIALTERAARRAGLECEMTVGSVATDDFRALVPLQSAIYNDFQGDETSGRTNTSHFAHWPNWETPDADYMLDDGIRQEGIGHVPEATPPGRWEKKRNKLDLEERAVANVRDWLDGVELSHSGLMALRAVRRAGKPGMAWGCIASGDWRGPTKLLRDLADALDDDGDVGLGVRQCIRAASAHIVGA